MTKPIFIILLLLSNTLFAGEIKVLLKNGEGQCSVFDLNIIDITPPRKVDDQAFEFMEEYWGIARATSSLVKERCIAKFLKIKDKETAKEIERKLNTKEDKKQYLIITQDNIINQKVDKSSPICPYHIKWTDDAEIIDQKDFNSNIHCKKTGSLTKVWKSLLRNFKQNPEELLKDPDYLLTYEKDTNRESVEKKSQRNSGKIKKSDIIKK